MMLNSAKGMNRLLPVCVWNERQGLALLYPQEEI